MAKEEKKYEEVFAQLEKLVQEIEKPERSLDSLEADVKKALEMISWCKEYIRTGKDKIDKMLE